MFLYLRIFENFLTTMLLIYVQYSPGSNYLAQSLPIIGIPMNMAMTELVFMI